MTKDQECKVIELLEEILTTLKAMKQQEYDYWETWKKAKSEEKS